MMPESCIFFHQIFLILSLLFYNGGNSVIDQILLMHGFISELLILFHRSIYESIAVIILISRV